MVPSLIAIAVGVGLILFARPIQRSEIELEEKGGPFLKFLKEGVESDGYVIMLRMFGSLWMLLGVVIATFGKKK